MRASKENLAVGWYLEPPFNDPHHAGFFHYQNWWNEEPWLCVDDKSGSVTRKPIPKEAAAYELARRHPHVGMMLMGRNMPGSDAEKFLLFHAPEAWPWLSAEAREDWCELVPPYKGRTDERLKIISQFEWSEVQRAYEFPEDHLQKFQGQSEEERTKHFKRLDREGTLRTIKRIKVLSRSANHKQRHALERVCDRAYLSLIPR